MLQAFAFREWVKIGDSPYEFISTCNLESKNFLIYLFGYSSVSAQNTY